MNDSPFHPTHTVPDGGLDARSQADPNQSPVARLDPWLEVEVLRIWGSWAEISCSNGWTAWVDARVLVAKAPPVVAPMPPPPPLPPVETPPVIETPPLQTPPVVGDPPPVESPQSAWSYEQTATPQTPVETPPAEALPVFVPTTQVPTVALPATPAYTQPATPAYTAQSPPPAYTAPPATPAYTAPPATPAYTAPPATPAYTLPTSASGYTQPPPAGQYAAAYQQAGASVPTARKLPVPAIVGGAIAALAGFAPWLRAGSASSKGFDVPAKFLVDYKTTGSGGIKVGLVVLAIAIVGGVLAALPGMGVWRRLCGWACVLAGALYVVQMQRLLSAFTGSPSLFDTVGFGALMAAAGGLVLALAPDASE